MAYLKFTKEAEKSKILHKFEIKNKPQLASKELGIFTGRLLIESNCFLGLT